MQPQDSGTDWIHWLTGLGGLLGFAAVPLQWVFRAGGAVPKIKEDIKEEIKSDLAAFENRIEDRMDSTAQAFDETLRGFREKINLVGEKINQVELYTERHFITKTDFASFVAENRQNQRELKDLLSKAGPQ